MKRAAIAFSGLAFIMPFSTFALNVSHPDATKIQVLGVRPDQPLVEHCPLGNAIRCKGPAGGKVCK